MDAPTYIDGHGLLAGRTVLVTAAADFENRAGDIADAAEDERLDRRRLVRLRGVVLHELPPLLAQLLFGYPLREQPVEPLANGEQAILDAPPHRRLRARLLVLALQVVIVARERGELLPPRESLEFTST